jgi:hypothetical protein
MLDVSGDLLPNTDLTYLAFRVAFQETLERIVLCRQFNDTNTTFGYLTEVPFLRNVAPHVQLDLLADTWWKHASDFEFQATLLDESVIYAVCETAARIADDEPTVVTHSMITGPRVTDIKSSDTLSGELRNLHLGLANEGDFLLISQFEDLPPEESADLKRQFRLEAERFEDMFDALGRWRVTEHLDERLDGLVTERELVRTCFVINETLQPRERRA